MMLEDAFPAAGNDTGLLNPIKDSLTALERLAKAIAAFSAVDVLVEANGVTVVETLADAPDIANATWARFDFEHTLLGKVQISLRDRVHVEIQEHGARSLAEGMFYAMQSLFEARYRARLDAASLAHEVATTIFGIGAMAEYLGVCIEREDSEAALRSANDIRDHARLGMYTVRSYLEVANPGNFRSARAEAIPLKPLLRDLVALYEREGKHRRVDFIIDDERLDSEILVRAADSDLRLALANILDNAVKYSYPGTTARVRVRFPYDLNSSRERIGVSVENVGPGISAEELSGVFESGFRGRAAAAFSPAGAGLGLAAVRQAVKRIGGAVSLKSFPQGRQGPDEASLNIINLVLPRAEA